MEKGYVLLSNSYGSYSEFLKDLNRVRASGATEIQVLKCEWNEESRYLSVRVLYFR